jgi:hypothetical protein
MAKKTAKSKNITKKSRIQKKREINRQSRLNAPVIINIQAEATEKKENTKVIWALIAVIGFIITILAFWLQTKPGLAVSSFTQGDPNNPLNTYFTISNDSVLALQNVRFVFVTNMIVGTNVFKNIQTSGNAGQQNVGRINAGQKISQNTGINIGNFSGKAEVEIKIFYFPQYYPQFSFLEKHVNFKFDSIQTSNGYSWIEQPAN